MSDLRSHSSVYTIVSFLFPNEYTDDFLSFLVLISGRWRGGVVGGVGGADVHDVSAVAAHGELGADWEAT